MHQTARELRTWFAEHEREILDDFFALLRFQSISTDPAFAHAMRQTAAWLCGMLQKMGGWNVQLWETAGHPVVFATHLKAGPDKPTLLIYNHYDVQPVDPIELWRSPPFEPVMRGQEIYARGASDNKGQCFYNLTALRAFLALRGGFGCNVKLLIEGEEECGSVGSGAAFEAHAEQLKADSLIVLDSSMPAQGVPGMTLGLRGILSMELSCRTAATDLHSGIHGGIAPNANRILCSLLSGLWDDAGRVSIPGFYDDVQDLDAKERALLDFSFDAQAYQEAYGTKGFSMEAGYSALESNWLRPTLEINGMWGGYTGLGFKTVIPARAFAKLSCRLVPNQSPEHVFARICDALRSRVPQGVELTCQMGEGAASFRSSAQSQIVQIAKAAMEEVFEKPCRFILHGASVPITARLSCLSGAQVALLGVALPGDDIHAPNEHFGWDRFLHGFLMMGSILDAF